MSKTYIKNKNNVYVRELTETSYFKWMIILILFITSVVLKFLSKIDFVFDVNHKFLIISNILLILTVGLTIFFIVRFVFELKKINYKLSTYIKNKKIEKMLTKWFSSILKHNQTIESKMLEIPDIFAFYDKDEDRFLIEIEMTQMTIDKEDFIFNSIKSALNEKYKSYVPYDFMLDDTHTKMIIHCLNITDLIEVYKPRRIVDLEPFDTFNIRLTNNVKWNLKDNSHALIAGVTGSGKSTEIFGIVYQSFVKGYDVYFIDPKNEFSVMNDFMDQKYFGDNIENSFEVLKKIAKINETRKQKIKEAAINKNKFGLKAIDLNYKPILLVADEIGSLMSQLDNKQKNKFKKMLQTLIYEARAQSIFVIMSTQQPSAEVIDTSVREQTTLKMLFGQSSAETRRMVFGDGAGYVSNTSKFEGYFVLNGFTTNIPQRISTIDLRQKDVHTPSFAKECYQYGQTHSNFKND